MALSWTTSELLVDIRAQARVSDDDPGATDTILLSEATRQLHRIFVPMVRKARAEYYQAWADQALIASQAFYPIPPRSAMASVRGVLVVDATGRERPLTPYPTQDRWEYTNRPGVPYHYMVVDDRLCLNPAPSTASLGTLRIIYEYRPGALVPVASCDTITSLHASTSTAPFDISSGGLFAQGAVVDCIRHRPPFAANFLGATITTKSVSEYTVLTPAAGMYRLPEVGDFICAEGETPIPQIPAELHPLLSQATAASYLNPIDPALAGELRNSLATELIEAQNLMSPRQQGTQIKIKSKSSYMRRRSAYRKGTFGDWT